ncbi:hypothetical protein OSTOST_18350, partial [Ostertagia ostertagi]
SGVRVGAIHVDPAGVLIDGGVASVLCGTHNPKFQRDAFFVDSQGKFSRLVVPFHLSMLRVTSQDQHDQLLLSKFSSSPYLDSFMEIYTMLRMSKSRRELILLILPLVNDSSKLGKDFGCNTEGIGRPTMSVGEFLGFIDCKSTSSALWERNYPDADLFRFGEFVFAPSLQGRIDVETFFDSVLVELPFALADFADLLSFVFIRYRSVVGGEGFVSLCDLLFRFEQLHPGSLEKCEKMALECTNLSRALLLYASCCLVKAKLPKKCKLEAVEPMETGEEDAIVQGI